MGIHCFVFSFFGEKRPIDFDEIKPSSFLGDGVTILEFI